MTTPIFDSIINGALSPLRAESASVPFAEIANALRNLPSDLASLERLLVQQLGQYIQFNFAAEKATRLGISDEEYHPLPSYRYPIKIDAFPEISETPKHRFYARIIAAEATRVKLALAEYSATAEADIDTRGEVRRTLDDLYHLSLQLKKVLHGEVIKYSLKQQMLTLYYEIAATFIYLLPEDKVATFDDYYYQIFGKYPDDEVKAAFESARLTAKAQLSIFANDIEAQKALLPQIVDIEPLQPITFWMKNSLFAGAFGISDQMALDTERGTRTLIRVFKDTKTAEYAGIETKPERIQKIETDLEMLSSITDGADTSAAASCLPWLKEQLKSADAMPGPSTSNVSVKQPAVPHIEKEELAPEVQLIVDRATEFKEVVAPFQFTSIAKVAALPEDKRELLIQKIAGEKVPYGVAMLLFLEYDEHLKKTYGYNKTKIAQHFAKCLKSNERTIRGNISVVKNTATTENSGNYTAGIHEDAVKQYYNGLLKKH